MSKRNDLTDLRAALEPVLKYLPDNLVGHQLEDRVRRELGHVQSGFDIIDFHLCGGRTRDEWERS